jgi:hypothetical protein
MNEHFNEPQAFTIPINPAGEQENMISVIDAVELTVKSDDECHRPEHTASTSLSDIQESVAPTNRARLFGDAGEGLDRSGAGDITSGSVT